MIHLHKRSLIAALMLWPLLLVGQTKEDTKSSDKNTDQLQLLRAAPKDEAAARFTSIPLEGPVDPIRYVIGPSDMFELGIWGPLSASYSVNVSPEGTIIVPTVGEVAVAGLNLVQAKQRVLEKVRTKYVLGDVTFTLVKPRSIIVTLRGAVLRQGQYILTVVDRVEKALYIGANVEPAYPTVTMQAPAENPVKSDRNDYVDLNRVAQQDEIYDRSSVRNITIVRKGGDTLHADIPRFYATGDDRYNPFLLEGDVIFVPQRNLARNSVGVFGAVNSPGRYEFVDGDSLLRLIQIAQGFTSDADLEIVRVERVNENGKKADELIVNVREVLEGKRPDVAIQRSDRIIVPAIPDSRGLYSVSIGGEVRKPGSYPILKRGTKLSEIVSYAGGFKDGALLSGAVIMRRSDYPPNPFSSQIAYVRNLRSPQLTISDSAYFNLDLKVTLHPVVVDFGKLFQDHDTTQDVILADGDVIYVPANDEMVLVQGQVQNPGLVSFVPGMSYKYYIEQAGGFSDVAVPGDTKVIKQVSREWMDPGDTSIKPGDQIWVPKRILRDFRYYFDIFRDMVGLAASVVTAVYLARQLAK